MARTGSAAIPSIGPTITGDLALGQPLPAPDERLLGQILGNGRIGGHTQAERVDPADVAVVEPLPGGKIAIDGTIDQTRNRARGILSRNG